MPLSGVHRLGQAKAREILRHGSVKGHALTAKQMDTMAAVAHGWKPKRKKK